MKKIVLLTVFISDIKYSGGILETNPARLTAVTISVVDFE